MVRMSSNYHLSLPSLVILSCAVVAVAVRLPDTISDLIPACARECFLSFLVMNYGAGNDDQLPSLDYLCSTRGATEYTIGEGAAQCIAAEKSVGYCSKNEASGESTSEEIA
ncbi:hypothetical protein DCS_01588 [Drechmeria coniospora]|uniref:Uncharacterized protein n=1 Tax=Drechmeria coniospora TaxID=98403 RepID=A0A151GTQ2_DRECN|nr:hypothetical protein DCS_01588 [Drechmeria coniospora]KYK60451.1 hypothetical protein DCS_01588 [Drechmeria coniospora]